MFEWIYEMYYYNKLASKQPNDAADQLDYADRKNWDLEQFKYLSKPPTAVIYVICLIIWAEMMLCNWEKKCKSLCGRWHKSSGTSESF